MNYRADEEVARSGEFARYFLVPIVVSILLAGGVYWIRQQPARSASSDTNSITQVQVMRSSAATDPRDGTGEASELSDRHPVEPKAAELIAESSVTASVSSRSLMPSSDEQAQRSVTEEKTSAASEQVPLQAVLHRERLHEPAAAAPPSAKGDAGRGPPSRIVLRYQSDLLAHIGQYRRYPLAARRERLQGTARVFFVMRRDGAVEELWLKTSWGQAILDNDAVDTIRRAQPLPPIPDTLPGRLNVELPVEFLVP